MKNWSATLRRPRRHDRNGYIICHIRSSELEDINRRVGFGKTGITLSYGLRLTWINTFWKWHDDMHAPVKDEPKWGPPGTNRPPHRAERPPPAVVFAPLRVCSRRFPNRPRKPHLGRRSRSLGSYGGKAPPQDYIRSPLTPGQTSNSFWSPMPTWDRSSRLELELERVVSSWEIWGMV
jgi:hypothetical protein